MQILVGCLFILTFPMDPTDPLTFRLIYGPPENGIRRRGSDGAVFQMLHNTSFPLSMVGPLPVTGLPPQLGFGSKQIDCMFAAGAKRLTASRSRRFKCIDLPLGCRWFPC